MIAVTIGVGEPFHEMALIAGDLASRFTGLKVKVLAEEHFQQCRARYPNHLKFRLFDLAEDDDILYFGADLVFLRAWDPAQFADREEIVCVRDMWFEPHITQDAESNGIPINEYFNSGMFIINRRNHERLLRAAEAELLVLKSRFVDQTALNVARVRLGIAPLFLDRRYNWLRFGSSRLRSMVPICAGHYTDIGKEEMLALIAAAQSSKVASDATAAFLSFLGPEPDLEIDEAACEYFAGKTFNYRRIGHDERAMEFRADGTMGEGATRMELYWFVHRRKGIPTLAITAFDEVTCELQEDETGVWRGMWSKYDRVPVELLARPPLWTGHKGTRKRLRKREQLPRVMWIGESPHLNTGFGKVSGHIVRGLMKLGKYEILCLCKGHPPFIPLVREEHYVELPVFPWQEFEDRLVNCVRQFKPDVVVAFGYPHTYRCLPDLKSAHPFKLVGYFSNDGAGIPRFWVPVIKAMDLAITYSRSTEREVRGIIPAQPTEMIYHGVQTKTFRPLRKREEIREREGLGGKFVVGCVARNHPRKQIPILLRAFASFAEGKDNVFLCLHMAEQDAGWHLPELIRRFRIANNTCMTRYAHYGLGHAERELNEIYNIFHVMALPTLGEGFGLPILESMSAGVPVLATRCTACQELIGSGGQTIKAAATIVLSNDNTQYFVADWRDLAAKLNRLYADPELIRRYGQAGRKSALLLDWSRIIPRWIRILDTLALSE